MTKLYPGISQVAASRMERIAGSYASMSNAEQVAFTRSLREARRKGARAKSVTGKVESNAEQANRDEAATGSSDSESSEHQESENAGG